MDQREHVNKSLEKFMYREKNSLVKFLEVFKSWGYRHLRNRVLQILQNFIE